MDRVEVVCVTMGQKDLTIADKMHITGDAVFGNQADGYRKETRSNAGRTLRMITTDAGRRRQPQHCAAARDRGYPAFCRR